ncbi:hypothetical protein [Kitasatospora sp. GP82]|uniref:hypothetical protein n=1 Tax=Kitasatospora sp. GP82 TaxID=3035089 RepID=UPI002476F36B|nr:hypothetical protein [Kitasatospora sp. GP82]MDH6129828.1 hypothetical protein [Kitasatospora sp. GP82]
MTFETAAWTALAAPLIALFLTVTVIGILGCVAIRKAPPGDVPKVLTALAAVVQAFRCLAPRSRPAGTALVIPAQPTETAPPMPATVVAGELAQPAPIADAQ